MRNLKEGNSWKGEKGVEEPFSHLEETVTGI